MEKQTHQRFGTRLHQYLDEFHTQQDKRRAHTPDRHDLMFVIPFALVGQDYFLVFDFLKIGSPAVRGHIDQLDLVWVVGQELLQAAPEVACAFFAEPDHILRSQQDRLHCTLWCGGLTPLFAQPLPLL